MSETAVNHKKGTSFRKRALRAVLPCLAVTFILCFFGPLDLTLNNASDLDYSPLRLLPYCAALWAGCFLAAWIVTSLCKGIVHRGLVSLCTGAALALYVQGAFLNPDFGAMDGHDIDWTSLRGQMVVNIIIWIVILAIPFIIRKLSKSAWRAFVTVIPAALLLMQAVPLGVNLINQAKADSGKSDYYISTENMLKLGSEQNIVVFLLDRTTDWIIDEMIESQGIEFMSQFRDFTRYDNCNSVYMHTVPSIAAILTGGEEWDYRTQSVYSYMDQIWQSEKADSFYALLKDAGYEREMYPLQYEVSTDIGKLSDKFENILPRGENTRFNRSPFKALIKLTLFRYLPIAIKEPFVIYSTDIAGLFTEPNAMRDQWDFVTKFNSEHLSADFSKTFRFYYLQGAHNPYKIGENGKNITSANGSKVQQITGFFKLFDDYIRELKALEIYDDTMIFIIADHGEPGMSRPDQQPIFFVKNFGERHGEMAVNHAPIEIQQQFLATIAAALDADSTLYGTPVWNTPEDLVIERHTTLVSDGIHPDNGPFYEYTYTGDGETLHELFANEEYTSVWDPKTDLGENDTRE